MEKNYGMSFEEAQDYVSKRGLGRMDILWNDGDIFIDEGDLTRTVGNVLKYADETMVEIISSWASNNVYKYVHSVDGNAYFDTDIFIEDLKKVMLS